MIGFDNNHPSSIRCRRSGSLPNTRKNISAKSFASKVSNGVFAVPAFAPVVA